MVMVMKIMPKKAATTQVDLEGSMPGDVSQAQKDRLSWISFIRGIPKKPDSRIWKTDQWLPDVGVGWGQEMGEGVKRHKLLVIRSITPGHDTQVTTPCHRFESCQGRKSQKFSSQRKP